MSENPAKIFGLYPKKGIRKPGADADVLLFDPTHQSVLPTKSPHLNVDYSMYEGRECTGAPQVGMQRGKIIMENGVFKGETGGGEFLPGTR